MDSLCWRGLQHLDPDLVFHSDESDDGIGSRHWSLRYQWNASALSCTVFDTMIAICPPGHHPHALLHCWMNNLRTWNVVSHLLLSTLSFQLPKRLNSNQVWCEIINAIINPLHSHYSRIAITTLSIAPFFTGTLVESGGQPRKRFNQIVPNFVNQLSKNFLNFCDQEDHYIAL